MNITQTYQRANGFTLVELLVGVVISLLISAAMLQLLVSTRQTYDVTSSISRVQENARFGHFFITRDLRQAADRNCVTGIRNLLAVDNVALYTPAIYGWEVENTRPGRRTNIPATSAQDTIQAANVRNVSVSGSPPFPNFPTILTGTALARSDVIIFSSYEMQNVSPQGANNGMNIQTISTDGAHGIAGDSIVLVGDCNTADMFQLATSSAGTSLTPTTTGTAPGNTNLNNVTPIWNRGHDESSRIYVWTTSFYYLANGPSGLPSLFRATTTAPDPTTAGINAFVVQELVEGVENMQVLFGEDSTGDNIINSYSTAAQITNWDEVISVRVGMIFRSPRESASDATIPSNVVLDNITVTRNNNNYQPDRLLRYVVNASVQLRNRGSVGLGPGLVTNVR